MEKPTEMERKTDVPYWPAIERWAKVAKRGDALPQSFDRTRSRIETFCVRMGAKETYTCDDVLRYMNVLEREGTCGSYRYSTMFMLKSLFVANDWPWTIKKHQHPKASPPRQEYFRPEEAALLLEASRDNPTLYMAIRLATILGIRRVELCMLKRSEYRRPRIYVKCVKRGISGWREMDPETCDELEKYMRIRDTPGDFLLVDDFGAPVHEEWLKSHLEHLLKRLGIYRPRLGWHGFRRGICTWLDKAGMSEGRITKDIGWQTPTMVHKYIQLDRDEAQAERLKKHPLLNHKT